MKVRLPLRYRPLCHGPRPDSNRRIRPDKAASLPLLHRARGTQPGDRIRTDVSRLSKAVRLPLRYARVRSRILTAPDGRWLTGFRAA